MEKEVNRGRWINPQDLEFFRGQINEGVFLAYSVPLMIYLIGRMASDISSGAPLGGAIASASPLIPLVIWSVQRVQRIQKDHEAHKRLASKNPDEYSFKDLMFSSSPFSKRAWLRRIDDTEALAMFDHGTDVESLLQALADFQESIAQEAQEKPANERYDFIIRSMSEFSTHFNMSPTQAFSVDFIEVAHDLKNQIRRLEIDFYAAGFLCLFFTPLQIWRGGSEILLATSVVLMLSAMLAKFDQLQILSKVEDVLVLKERLAPEDRVTKKPHKQLPLSKRMINMLLPREK